MPPPESPLWPTPASLLKLRTGQQHNKSQERCSPLSVSQLRSSRCLQHANPYVDKIKIKLNNIMKPPVHSFDELTSQSQETGHSRTKHRAALSEKRQDTVHDKTSFIENGSHELISSFFCQSFKSVRRSAENLLRRQLRQVSRRWVSRITSTLG